MVQSSVQLSGVITGQSVTTDHVLLCRIASRQSHHYITSSDVTSYTDIPVVHIDQQPSAFSPPVCCIDRAAVYCHVMCSILWHHALVAYEEAHMVKATATLLASSSDPSVNSNTHSSVISPSLSLSLISPSVLYTSIHSMSTSAALQHLPVCSKCNFRLSAPILCKGKNHAEHKGFLYHKVRSAHTSTSTSSSHQTHSLYLIVSPQFPSRFRLVWRN